MISVNVGGRRYKVHQSHLMRYPDTLLAKTNYIKHFYDSTKDEFFFDRDPDMFRYVSRFYLTGKIHCPYEYDMECWELYREEMEFFGIPLENFTGVCCLDDYLDKTCRQEDDDFQAPDQNDVHDIELDDANTIRGRIRRGLEDPMSSYGARIFHVFIGIVIAVNVCANAIETIHCQADKILGECYPTLFFVINSLCVPIFTAEYILGVLVSSSPCQHVRQPFNVIDLLAIVPFYVNIIVEQLYQGKNQDLQSFSVLRVFRIFRVLKFARYSQKLTELFHSIKKSSHELSVLLCSYSLTVVLFSSVLYYMERTDPSTPFVSIPGAIWYTIVSTTTLGYGDIVPVTLIGKMIGGMCCIIGALVISFPVPVIHAKAKGLTKASKKEGMLL
ncbi:potassium voltage-gated channel subfamily D member 1 [Exaiptasia diaphana]|uniref:BTB domain-containing protein n=1 Tax=Exaiptasia diaphana TaxID=2652724 RepID=A0A913XNP5_EXADI|nr:potassium voltage-gated channel subfamily D member 1 [Exaiptasia diaphana]KXJ10702.1 Potassium voltage-gated channel subfamily D member 1 [Exaiptasia diaphana]